MFKFGLWLILVLSNWTIVTWRTASPDEVNNYEEYLGPLSEQTREDDQDEESINYEGARIPKRGTGPVSTVVCNHIGYLDCAAVAMSPLHPGFTPKESLYHVPIMGNYMVGF
jgi:hypothetical protein